MIVNLQIEERLIFAVQINICDSQAPSLSKEELRSGQREETTPPIRITYNLNRN